MPTRKLNDLETTKVRTAVPCFDPEHRPPMHMVYENGVWEHTCPTCGCQTIFTVNRPTL